MPRLKVDATARWAGSEAAGFATFPILLGVSVSDAQGLGVAGLPDSAFHVRYVDDPDSGSVAGTATFFRELAARGTTGAYELVFQPSAEQPGERFRQDEVFVFVTVGHAGDNGQTVTLARFRVFG